MKLAVSNIAWGAEAFPDFVALARDVGCDGVELAASLLWPEPVDSSAEERAEVRGLVDGANLEIAGFHALLYTRPDLALFDTDERRRATVDYLKRACELCGDVGGRVLVFGSPRSRARSDLPLEQAFGLAAAAFRDVAETAAGYGVWFLIEPLGPEETDFVTTTAEGVRLVELVGHPHFRLHLDAKAVLGESGDAAAAIAAAIHVLEHVHASGPDLQPPETAGLDHAALGHALRSSGYDRYVSVEMRRGEGPPAEQIERSVDYVRRCYLGA